jgi:hypothetical protein
VQDVNDVDALGRLASDTIENLVTVVNPVTHATVFVARHNWECDVHVGKATALLAHETQCTAAIVAGHVIADRLKIGLSIRKDLDNYRLAPAIA